MSYLKDHHHDRIFWIYNWADRKIDFRHKYPHLKQALSAIFDQENGKKKHQPEERKKL